MISTPIGLFKANSKTPLNQFDFWVLHSNFSFSKNHCAIIDKTIGVETQTLLSPFKNLISIGKLFDPERIKQLVELRVLGRIINNGISVDSLDEDLRNELQKSNLASVLFPNGHILRLDKNDYHEDIRDLRKTSELVGGIFQEAG